jgi:hypothetical protein
LGIEAGGVAVALGALFLDGQRRNDEYENI